MTGCHSAQDFKTSGVWLSPHPQLHVTGIDVGGGTLERQSICVEAVHIEIQTVIMQKIKHDILSVSKAVAYQKYVDIKPA